MDGNGHVLLAENLGKSFKATINSMVYLRSMVFAV